MDFLHAQKSSNPIQIAMQSYCTVPWTRWTHPQSKPGVRVRLQSRGLENRTSRINP